MSRSYFGKNPKYIFFFCVFPGGGSATANANARADAGGWNYPSGFNYGSAGPQGLRYLRCFLKYFFLSTYNQKICAFIIFAIIIDYVTKLPIALYGNNILTSKRKRFSNCALTFAKQNSMS